MTGNLLLGVALRLFLVCLLSGSTAIVEHPAEPQDRSDMPSIWRLDVIQLFLRFPFCQRLRVLQGCFGAPSVKPTDLLVAHAPQAEHLLRAGKVTEVPVGSSIGKNAQGVWNTSRLKQYPGALCKTLARIFLDAQAEEGEADVPLWFEAAVQKLVAHFDTEAPMGPDYHAAAVTSANS